MCAVVLAVGGDNTRFVSIACITLLLLPMPVALSVPSAISQP